MSGTKRRGNGEGSISLRKDGRWSAIISLENGKRQTFYGKTRKEVRDKLQAALCQIEQQTFVGTSQQKLGDFLAHWLEDTHKYHLRQRTYERYDQIVHLHLIPGLGHHPLQKLAPQHLQTFYKQKLEEGLSKSTVGTFHNVLHKALDTALRWGLVARNVSELVTPPRKEHYEIQPLSIEQVQQLLKALPGNPLEMLFLLALGTGMRQGEILALKWQDIDLVRETHQVRRVLTHVTARLRKKGEPAFIETEPKTARGRRCLALPECVHQALIAYKEQQALQIREAGPYWQNHDYVFCTRLGNHLTPNYVVTTFKSLLKKAGLPDIRFHDPSMLFHYSLPGSSARSRGRLNSEVLCQTWSSSIGFVVILSSRNNRKDASYEKADDHSDDKIGRQERLQGIFAPEQTNIPCACSSHLTYESDS